MARREVTLSRIAPVSAFKVGIAMALVGLIAWLLAVTLLYFGMAAAGIWDSVNALVGDVGGDFHVTFGVVFSACALVGAIMAILVAILVPVMAIIYNAIAELFGGFTCDFDD